MTRLTSIGFGNIMAIGNRLERNKTHDNTVKCKVIECYKELEVKQDLSSEVTPKKGPELNVGTSVWISCKHSRTWGQQVRVSEVESSFTN